MSLELMRWALLGDAIGATFPVANTATIVGLLVLTTALMIIVCSGVFLVSEHIAREWGQIDRTTSC